jgi:dTDP-4-amino-4,6-dideoxygalactose transaminase
VRAALALARLSRLEADVERRRELTRAYRTRLAEIPGVIVPFGDDEVARSSCYVMPIMLAEPERRADFRRVLQDAHGVQTSILYPAVHEFTAYRQRFPDVALPRTEQAARREVTIPLYPHMTEPEQERVLIAVQRAASA